MSGPAGKNIPKILPNRRHHQTIATTVEVRLPPVRWTPDLIDGVARVLAGMLVRDLQQRPPGEPIKPT